MVKKYHLPVALYVPLESSFSGRVTQESNPATLASIPTYSERINPYEEELVLISHFFSVKRQGIQAICLLLIRGQ